uniref:Aurein-3.3 n=1 Tax=Ranoidea raniformis TaxID=116057 RepID=AUR33_RANRN|nr:RecName: Full=Aurein-3.3; Contains: RecName: Full=Aurein-3.3.1 [Ranoidea raniformis]7QV6_A Chain A, Aurein-3.3 [Ranoidea raniformis]7QV6_B Chain B, Aurein-3.3 [Ranoidea raniformis]7QV6_C Chain C, Aurein-3.3 [Ranoidea raniformis]7QV6_D Chain D, Aurein-3.3 [Ranoidea raniformis]7QV6_E Chain E, Aurein-3.3 [Ranoidea raniformis]7QV6_F Chain F, Aurein-3.3 [Ranoidea raniformis]7QV6_G Chain G, Aurein-3.3 [Ranoidea raniformis]7QV6_H Chain H, Aurein-3.3 [Ranoidea raniformis]7QV6_I Chain I, Aurein-
GLFDIVKKIAGHIVSSI